METESIPPRPSGEDEGRVGFLGVFTSPAVESAFRTQHFRDNRWLSIFLVSAAMLRVSLLLTADYEHFGVGPAFWLLFTSRLLFVLVSVYVLVALRRAACPAAAERLFLRWGFLLIAVTVQALSARPPSNHELLFMSFGMILVTYCVAPLRLSHQATLALTYSGLAFYACRHVDGATLSGVAAVHTLSHIFGAVSSWRLNHRRRETYLGTRREAQLRSKLEAAVAEIKTLRGMLCICAWCKKIRDQEEVWEPVEEYVQSRTQASFSHGICPECLKAQVGEMIPALP